MFVEGAGCGKGLGRRLGQWDHGLINFFESVKPHSKIQFFVRSFSVAYSLFKNSRVFGNREEGYCRPLPQRPDNGDARLVAVSKTGDFSSEGNPRGASRPPPRRKSTTCFFFFRKGSVASGCCGATGVAFAAYPPSKFISFRATRLLPPAFLPRISPRGFRPKPMWPIFKGGGMRVSKFRWPYFMAPGKNPPPPMPHKVRVTGRGVFSRFQFRIYRNVLHLAKYFEARERSSPFV